MNFDLSAMNVEQDAYLLRLIRVEQPKRLRTKDEDRKRSRNNMSSFLLTNQGKGHLRVCKATLCGVLVPHSPDWPVRVEARLLNDLYSVDGGLKLPQKEFTSPSGTSLNGYCPGISLDLVTHVAKHFGSTKKPVLKPEVDVVALNWTRGSGML
ncbi:hypothetical protein RRG08_056581 [Elysia crispata]|uniref:Uncharacterized protein n=1 Tax=Elysia crispata TaxID=231223 RepID=A0AAE0Z3A7_9GAST|nr:hypothetical protein RRG08_056581 [Elysia crispata]